jgi:uncharacterized membrane protein YdjX (TVP38/TMEM64 family)
VYFLSLPSWATTLIAVSLFGVHWVSLLRLFAATTTKELTYHWYFG